MAMITPASDAFPSMIPPTDFPADDRAGGFSHEADKTAGASLVCIEPRELNVLTGFLAAFSRYLADRHNPEASAGVMAGYRAAIRFYDGLEDRPPNRSARREPDRAAARPAKRPANGRPSASGKGRSRPGRRGHAK